MLEVESLIERTLSGYAETWELYHSYGWRRVTGSLRPIHVIEIRHS
jgi:hypothetical protein